MRLRQPIPMLPVAVLDTRIAFDERLGFVVEDRNDAWRWARLRCGNGERVLDPSIAPHRSIPRIAMR
jgi:hypothetical protein